MIVLSSSPLASYFSRISEGFTHSQRGTEAIDQTVATELDPLHLDNDQRETYLNKFREMEIANVFSELRLDHLGRTTVEAGPLAVEPRGQVRHCAGQIGKRTNCHVRSKTG